NLPRIQSFGSAPRYSIWSPAIFSVQVWPGCAVLEPFQRPSRIEDWRKPAALSSVGPFACRECSITRPVVVPAAKIMTAPMTAAFLIFVHALTFNAPLRRFNVGFDRTAPFATATAQIVLVKPAGAA